MFKVAYSGKYHFHIVRIAIVDGKLIFNRTSRLNYGIDAIFMGNLHAIREWEEGIRGHNGTF